MSCVLYYSNACENCKKIIMMISKTKMKDDMYFICIDKRYRKSNGATYILLQDGQEVLLPPTVNRVPALLLLNKGHHVLFGDDIVNHIKPEIEIQQQKAVNYNGEPMAFSIYSSASNYGVASDNYSFLDQNADDLSAKGNGGMRQQHHYASINNVDNIDTPPDTYQPDKIGSVSMESLRQNREQDIMKPRN
jgi:hypothetical protein